MLTNHSVTSSGLLWMKFSVPPGNTFLFYVFSSDLEAKSPSEQAGNPGFSLTKSAAVGSQKAA